MKTTCTQDLLLIPEQKCGSFHLRPQYVSFKDNKEQFYKTLTQDEYQFITSLGNRRLSKKEMRGLEMLKVHYPAVPEITNLLTFFYLQAKKLKQAEQLILESYQIYPDNLFAKINYADYCLRKKQFKKIPTIFSHAFDLTLLYPSREVFHITEFRGFMTLMGFYHLAIQNKEHAVCYHYLARRIDPKHPAVRLLGRSIYHTSFLKKILDFIKLK